MLAAVPLLLLAVQGTSMPPPVEATPANTVTAPSAGVRAALVEGIAALPARPRAFRFQCMVGASTGYVRACIPLGDGFPETPAGDLYTFGQRSDQFVARIAATADHRLQDAAYARVRFYRMVATAPRPADGIEATRFILFREVIAAGDRPAPGTGTPVPRAEILFDTTPGGDTLSSYYPPAALHAAASASVQASCLVQPDRTLLCTGGQVVRSSAALDPAMQRQFVLAAYQSFGLFRVRAATRSGAPAVGRRFPLSITFQSPQ